MKQAHDTCAEFARCAGRTDKPPPSDRVRRRTANDFPWEMAMTRRPCASNSAKVRMSTRGALLKKRGGSCHTSQRGRELSERAVR